MSRHRFTIEELKSWSDERVIAQLITDRQTECTNPYSPFFNYLSKLRERVLNPNKEISRLRDALEYLEAVLSEQSEETFERELARIRSALTGKES